jgi:hypothetical protein
MSEPEIEKFRVSAQEKHGEPGRKRKQDELDDIRPETFGQLVRILKEKGEGQEDEEHGYYGPAISANFPE